MLLKRNRYKSADLPVQLRNQYPQKSGNERYFKFVCNKFDPELDDFEAYLPESTQEHEPCRALLLDFFEHINELDNMVQDSCESEHKQSGMDISIYKLHIGYIDIKEKSITVCYYGTVVNTEWDVEFQKSDQGEWVKVNF